MAQMRPAVITDNLGPTAIGVGDAFYRSGDFIVKTGPAAMGIKLILRPVERRAASFTKIYPRFIILIILTGEGTLGFLVNDNPLFR